MTDTRSSDSVDKVKEIVIACFEKFEEDNGVYLGYMDGKDVYENFLTELAVAGYTFVTRSSRSPSAEPGKNAFYFKQENKKELSTPGIPFCGSPFQMEKVKILHCANGEKYQKSRYSTQSVELEDGPQSTKKSSRLVVTRKLGCPGRMTVKCIRLFPDFVVPSDPTWREKKEVIQKLKDCIKEGAMVRTIQRYYVNISSALHHTHAETVGARLHPSLISEIHRMVERNVTSIGPVQVHLRNFVEDMFKDTNSKPSVLNSCFYPSKKTIANHVFDALVKVRKNRLDQDALQVAVKQWEAGSPNDHLFFRPHTVTADTTSSFIFCHQTKWQQQVLSRYGNRLCVLDATHKTTKYSLPLFFVIVKTNVGHCVVATFAIESESQEGIQEALETIKSWNPEWQPTNFFTDFSECEIKAVEAVFPQCKVYICPFHREQHWTQWLNKRKNVSEEDALVLKDLLHVIAHSHTEEEYEMRLKDLRDSDSWKNCKIAHQYFSSQWLSNCQRWVEAFYSRGLFFDLRSNNGIEAQNQVLRNFFLRKHSEKTLTGVLTAIIEELLPDQYKKYSINNAKLSANYRMYNKEIPSYLQDRPHRFVRHVMNRLEKAKLHYNENKIQDISGGAFLVQSEDNEDVWYVLTFNPVCCGCTDYSRWMFPCKHFCAIFLYVPSWPFDRLSAEYKQSVFLMIDPEIANSTSTENSANDAVDNIDVLMFVDCDYTDLCEVSVEDSECAASNLYQPERSLDTLQENFREIIKKALHYSYLCQDKTVLQKAVAEAQSVVDIFQEGAAQDESHYSTKSVKRSSKASCIEVPKKQQKVQLRLSVPFVQNLNCTV